MNPDIKFQILKPRFAFKIYEDPNMSNNGDRRYLRIVKFEHPNGDYWEVQTYSGILSLNDVNLLDTGWQRYYLENLDNILGYSKFLGQHGGFVDEKSARWYCNRISVEGKRVSIVGSWEKGQAVEKEPAAATPAISPNMERAINCAKSPRGNT